MEESSPILSTRQTNEWRLQSTSNKQGSDGFVTEYPEEFTKNKHPEHWAFDAGAGNYLTRREDMLQREARSVYEERLKFGVAREQARKDLPLSTYTEFYWKIDLRNLLGFLSLRLDFHAQLEIRQYAEAIYDITKQLYPLCVEAFDEYDPKRGGLLLTKTEVDILKHIFETTRICCRGDYIDDAPESFFKEACVELNIDKSKREFKEMIEKFKRFGINTK